MCVVACDAFVLFDPRPFFQKVVQDHGKQGAVVAAGFRQRLFDYGWLRALGGRYVDFEQLSADALRAGFESAGLRVPAEQLESLLECWFTLPLWPDAHAGVQRLATLGVQVAVLSNWSPGMLSRSLARVGLAGQVRALSTDLMRTYKPDPAAYGLALDAYRVQRDQVAFVGFAGWDVAGACWFGYPTVWMNRIRAPREQLGANCLETCASFEDSRVLRS